MAFSEEEIQELQQQYENLEKHNLQLIQDNENIRSQMSTLMESLNLTQRENNELADQIESLKNDLRTQFVLSQSLRQENEFFENQNQEYRKEMQQGGEYYNQVLDENEQFRQQLQQRNQQIDQLLNENNTLKDQLMSLQEENDQIAQDLQNIQGLINSNEMQYQDVINLQNSDQKRKQKKQNRKQIKELERLIIKREQEISQLFGAIEEMKIYASQLKHQSDKYEQKLQETQKELQYIEMDRNKYAMKIEQMQNQNDRYSSLQQQMSIQEKNKLTSIKNQYDQLSISHLELQQQFQSQIDANNKLSQEFMDLQELNEQYLHEAAIQQNSVKEKESKLERLQLQLQQQQSKDLNIQQQINLLTQQNKEYLNGKQELVNQIQQLQKENSTLHFSITQLKEQQLKELRDHQNQQDQLKRDKNTLAERLKGQDEIYSELDKKYKNLEIYLKQIEEERLFRAQAEQSFEDVSQQCMQLQDQNRDLLRQIANLENDIQKNEDELRQLRKNNKSSQNFDKSTQQLILKDREILHLQSVVERLEGMNKQLQQECDRLAAKIQITSHENSLLSKTNREINQMGRLLLEGQQVKELLEKKKFDKPLTLTTTKTPQIVQQLQQHSRRPSVKK